MSAAGNAKNLEMILRDLRDVGAHNVPLVLDRSTTSNNTNSSESDKDGGVSLLPSHAFDDCVQKYDHFGFRPGVTYCNATFDSFLCWPPTEGGATAFQNCPAERLSDTTRLAFRRCGLNGLWMGRKKDEYDVIGWTNYTPCFPAEVQTLLGRVYDDKADPQVKFQIALYTRYLEIIGFSVSLVALLISLFIFMYFRSLRNTRTKIHTNLYVAMIVQVIVRLVLYSDQEMIRNGPKNGKFNRGLMSMPYACIACYILLEYAISSMFTWMFIEGLFLYNILTASSMRERINYLQLFVVGWGFPIFTTFGWAVATFMHYDNPQTIEQCWYGYNFLNEYWIVQAPRATVIMVNFLFLLNIVSVVVSKLQATESNEIERAKKAVRAALVLLPLLGITNILNMIEAPLEGSVWRFALWSYTTHFLRSFEGFFISLIYCFLNGEVREVLMRHYNDWKAMRNDQRRIRALSAQTPRQREEHEAAQTPEWVSDTFNPNFAISDMTVEMTDSGSVHTLYSDPHVLDNLPVLRLDTSSDVPQIVCDGLDNVSAVHIDFDVDSTHIEPPRRRTSSDSDFTGGVSDIRVAADINLVNCPGNGDRNALTDPDEIQPYYSTTEL